MAKIGRMVKETSVRELSTRFTDSPDFFIAEVNRLTASDANTLRQQLFGSQSSMMLIKRRLGLLAVEPLKISGLSDLLNGPIALVFSGEDTAQTAKLIVEFRKAHEGQISVRGAVIEGRLMNKALVEQLATLPPRPQLLAEVLGMIEAPLSDLIFTVERLMGDIAWIVEQIAEQKPPEPKPDAAPEAKPQEPPNAQDPPPQAPPEPPKPTDKPDQTPNKPEEGTGS